MTHQVLFVFWDSDNTLVNTAEHHWRKHFETLKTLGLTLDETYRKRIYENNGMQNWAWLTAELGLKLEQQDYLDKIDAWYFDHIVMSALEAKKLAPSFDFILCKEDYEGRKPEPTPYLTALKKMEELYGETIDPKNCLVIEDDPLGVQAGEAAGMTVLYRPIGDEKSIKALVS